MHNSWLTGSKIKSASEKFKTKSIMAPHYSVVPILCASQVHLNLSRFSTPIPINKRMIVSKNRYVGF